MSIEKILSYVTAAVAGYLFISLPKVVQRKLSGVVMLSSIGLAGVVGFISGSVLSYLFPALPLDVVVGFRCVAGYCRVLFGLRLIATKTAHRDMFRAHLGKSKLCIRGHRCLREPAESCFVKPPYMRAKSVEIG